MHGDLQLTDDERIQTVVETLLWQPERPWATRVVDRVRNVQFAKTEQWRIAVQTQSVVIRNRQQARGIEWSLYMNKQAMAVASAARLEYILIPIRIAESNLYFSIRHNRRLGTGTV